MEFKESENSIDETQSTLKEIQSRREAMEEARRKVRALCDRVESEKQAISEKAEKAAAAIEKAKDKQAEAIATEKFNDYQSARDRETYEDKLIQKYVARLDVLNGDRKITKDEHEAVIVELSRAYNDAFLAAYERFSKIMCEAKSIKDELESTERRANGIAQELWTKLYKPDAGKDISGNPMNSAPVKYEKCADMIEAFKLN